MIFIDGQRAEASRSFAQIVPEYIAPLPTLTETRSNYLPIIAGSIVTLILLVYAVRRSVKRRHKRYNAR